MKRAKQSAIPIRKAVLGLAPVGFCDAGQGGDLGFGGSSRKVVVEPAESFGDCRAFGGFAVDGPEQLDAFGHQRQHPA